MIDHSLPDISLMMIRDNMENLPAFDFPQGYSFRLYQPGDEKHWARIMVSAGEFKEEKRALEIFAQEFMKHPEALYERMLFIVDDGGNAVGTTSAWIDDLPLESAMNPAIGRIHWVSVEEDHQGKGLARPMLSAAMDILKSNGCKRAYLLTQPPSYVAIRLYLQFGFEPVLTGTEENETGWRCVRERIDWKWQNPGT